MRAVLMPWMLFFLLFSPSDSIGCHDTLFLPPEYSRVEPPPGPDNDTFGTTHVGIECAVLKLHNINQGSSDSLKYCEKFLSKRVVVEKGLSDIN
jgi:hypothetical protein